MYTTSESILPTNYFGSTAAAIQAEDFGHNRIYYQSANGAINEVNRVGSHIGGQLIPAENVRVNTPIAAITWGDSFSEIRVYFIDPCHYIREYSYSATILRWVPGALDELRYKAAPNSGLLYAVNTPDGKIRVGFQAANDPGIITEVQTSSSRGIWASA